MGLFILIGDIKMPKNLENKPSENIKEVNWTLTLYMSLFFGWLGVDRFIMGKVGTGILKLIVCVLLWPFGFGIFGAIWWLIDLILILTSHNFEGVKWEFPKEKMPHIIIVSVLLVIGVLIWIFSAFVFLGFIISFTRSIFDQGSNQLEDVWSDMQLAMKASPDYPVFFEESITIKRGESQSFGVSVYNKLANTLYNAKPVITDCINSAGETVSEKITFITVEADIPSGGEQSFFGKIKASEELTPDMYVCSVVITADGHDPYVVEYPKERLMIRVTA